MYLISVGIVDCGLFSVTLIGLILIGHVLNHYEYFIFYINRKTITYLYIEINR